MSSSSMLTHVWVIPALMTVSFVAILFFGKRFSERVTSSIGIFFVAVCFVLSCVAGVQWIQRVNASPTAPASASASAEAAANTQPNGRPAEGPGVVAEGANPLSASESPSAGAEPQAGGTPAASEAPAQGDTAEVETTPVVTRWTWFEIGSIKFEFGFIGDGLSVMMLFTVTFISLLVHVYSKEYLHDDIRFTHFYAFLSLFTAAMLFYVTSSSTIQMLVGWELVGVCSFVLIGHWWEDKKNSDAALKAFLTNRVGDVGLMLGIIVTFFAAGATSFDVLHINQAALSGTVSTTLLLVGALLLFGGVTSKSGQFPLHTWLPDAMAGPTPVSALIHAATMVVAGVYLIARLYPVFFQGLHIGTSTFNYVAFIGAFTTVFGASMAFVQFDIKKVLAYSTISQLGYMVMGLGVGAWTGGVFHLFTHAFFKACLFLGAGSVSHAAHHTFDMREMGGLRKYMRRTYVTFTVAMLALIALPPLAGFWSKDEILSGAAQGQGGGSYTVMVVMGLITAFMTAAYMIRCWYLTFHGEYRGHGTPHESPSVMTVPLMILAVAAVGIGWVNIPKIGFVGAFTKFEHYVQPSFLFPHLNPIDFNPLIAMLSIGLAGMGILAAWQFYWRKSPFMSLTERSPVFARGYQVLVNRYYLDHLYTDVIVAAVKGPIARGASWSNTHVLDAVVNGVGRGSVIAGRGVYFGFDQPILDGMVVGSAREAGAAGEGLSYMQTGKVQWYAALMFAGATILAAIFVFTV